MKCTTCESEMNYLLTTYPKGGVSTEIVEVYRCLRCGGNFTKVKTLNEINGKK